MKLSIIIISYNEKDYLPDAIESCLNQKIDGDYEIIIGDDGSNDGSIELIQSYQEEYPDIIKYFVMERENIVNIIPSIRVSNIISKAMKMSVGDYQTILSADDIQIDMLRLKKQIAFLEQNSEYDSCYTHFSYFWDDGRVTNIRWKNNASKVAIWGGKRYIHISCFVFRRMDTSELLEHFCDDTGLLFCLINKRKMQYIPINGFGYRQRSDSIMHKSDELELNLIELCLLRDVSALGTYKKCTSARFNKSLRYVFKNRKHLTDDKYSKYLQMLDGENMFLRTVIDFDHVQLSQRLLVRCYLLQGMILGVIFICWRKIESFIGRIQL